MKTKSVICVLLAGAFWGLIAIPVSFLSADGFSNYAISLFRTGWAASLLLVYILLTDPKLLKIRLRDVWCFVGTGIFSLLFFNLCYYTAIDQVGVSVAAVLLYTAPALVVIFSAILFGEKIGRRKILVVVATFVGSALTAGVISGQGVSIHPYDLLVGLGAGFGYALYSVFSRYAINRGYSAMTITFYTFLLASIGVLPLALPSFQSVGGMLSLQTILWSAQLGVVSCLVPYLLYTNGMKNLETGTASVLATVEPVVAVIAGVLLFEENITPVQLVGMLLVIGGVVVLGSKKTPDKHMVTEG